MNMNPFIGRQMLEVVTAGMYSEPRMVLREYVQNAADSIDQAELAGIMELSDGSIGIDIDGKNRSIVVEDNGIGLSNIEAKEYLCSLGWSKKNAKSMRGFRGIGRLGGLGYCSIVEFETRNNQNEDVAVVTWDGQRFRDLQAHNSSKQNLNEVIEQISDLKFRKPTINDLPHFFRISMIDVQHFHKDELMDVKRVRDYLSQVAPVSYESKFSFAQRINEYLSLVEGYRSYEVKVNGKVISRPYINQISHSQKSCDQIKDVELFEFVDDTGELIARGWFAKMDYLASIPSHLHMRGIRVRQGNIQIGGENVLESAFSEGRFAYWHIGEIVASYKLKTNARRDGFEQSNIYQKFLEQVNMLGQYLSNQCRQSSKRRGAIIRAERNLGTIDKLLDFSIYVDERHFDQSLDSIQNLLQTVEKITIDYDLNGYFQNRTERIRSSLNQKTSRFCELQKQLDGRALKNLSHKDLLEEVSRGILEAYDDSESANDLLGKIINPYLTPDRKTKISES